MYMYIHTSTYLLSHVEYHTLCCMCGMNVNILIFSWNVKVKDSRHNSAADMLYGGNRIVQRSVHVQYNTTCIWKVVTGRERNENATTTKEGEKSTTRKEESEKTTTNEGNETATIKKRGREKYNYKERGRREDNDNERGKGKYNDDESSKWNYNRKKRGKREHNADPSRMFKTHRSVLVMTLYQCG